MALLKTKIFTIIFGIQCLVLVLEITSVSSIPQSEQQIRPARRRQSDSSFLYGNQIYGAAKLQKRPSRRRPNSAPTSHPNSYYSRLLTNTIKPSRTDRQEKHKDERDKTLHHHHGGLFDDGLLSHSLFGGGSSSNGNRHGLHGLHSIHHFHHNSGSRRGQSANPCYYRNRRRNYRSNSNREQEGRFLWDLNLYNVHHGGGHHSSAQYDDCNDYGGSGLYSDNGPIRRPPLSYLELLANGGQGLRPLGGSRPSGNRPSGTRPYRPSGGSLGGGGGGGGGSDNDIDDSDVYDPVYDDRNRPVYESQLDANAGPVLSPGQIVGGVAHTVNGIIQTLAGNTQQYG